VKPICRQKKAVTVQKPDDNSFGAGHTPESLAEQFEEHRAHLRAVAYRMLGSPSETEDAVQESWIRLGRTDVSAVENLRAWLTTVVARVCWTCCGGGRRAGRVPLTCTCLIW
jgi:DNA-directed RNA polymerase specialized sigma24 family protein